MKTVIICGGRGTRYNTDRPKALAMIGNKPIIHHLLDIYITQGHNDFILALGWKQEEITQYFDHCFGTETTNDEHRLIRHIYPKMSKYIAMQFVDTGQDSHTGKRLKLIEDYIPKTDENFFVNYCDGLSNVDLTKLQVRHLSHKNIATLTAIRPINQFGELIFDENDNIIRFEEKPKLHNYINGGFFIFNKKIFKYIDEDKNQELEKDILTELAIKNELGAYKHNGFWQTLNTPKDEIHLNNILTECTKQNKPPIWLRTE